MSLNNHEVSDARGHAAVISRVVAALAGAVVIAAIMLGLAPTATDAGGTAGLTRAAWCVVLPREVGCT